MIKLLTVLFLSASVYAQCTLVMNPKTRALQCAGSGSGGGAVTAGTGITVTGSAVSIDDTVTATRAQVQSGADNTCTDSGGDDTYACTLTPPLGSYTTGMRLSLKVTTTNTGAATVDAGPGAKTIKTASGATMADGDIVVGAAIQIAYDGTDFRLVGSSASSVTYTGPYLTIAGTNYLPLGYSVTLPPTASWTADNCGTCTFTTSGLNGALTLVGGTTNPALFSQRRSFGADRTLIAAVAMAAEGNSANLAACGIGVKGATNGDFRVFGPSVSNTAFGIVDISFTDATTANAITLQGGITGSYALIKLEAGTNLVASVSGDGGISYQQIFSFSFATLFGAVVSNSDEWVFTSKANGGGKATTCTLLSWSTA